MHVSLFLHLLYFDRFHRVTTWEYNAKGFFVILNFCVKNIAQIVMKFNSITISRYTRFKFFIIL